MIYLRHAARKSVCNSIVTSVVNTWRDDGINYFVQIHYVRFWKILEYSDMKEIKWSMQVAANITYACTNV